jgi:predicted metal-dependent hydrolase
VYNLLTLGKSLEQSIDGDKKSFTLQYIDWQHPQIQVEPSGLYIQDMPKRWGSCTPKGKIILNPELIKAPRACIEYVIIHELCHLIHHDHTQKFFDLQTKEMPNWVKWKERLEKIMV